MAQIVRAALIQHSWTGDKDSMIAKAVDAIGAAASAGARVACLQELFYGPYFCQVQDSEYYSYTELIPDGPTTQLMREVARRHEIVLIVPMYEEELPGLFYNTAAVIDADGSYLGKHRKNAHSAGQRDSGKSTTSGRATSGYPVFDTAVGKIGVYICYERHFPEGWRALGLGGAKIVFNPSATSRGLSEYLWQLEQTSAAAVANEYFVGTINRVGVEPLGDDDFYGQSYFADPRGQIMGEHRLGQQPTRSLIRDLDMDLLEEVRHQWAVLPGPPPGLLRPAGPALAGGTDAHPDPGWDGGQRPPAPSPPDVLVRRRAPSPRSPRPGTAVTPRPWPASAGRVLRRGRPATCMPGGIDVHTHMEMPFGGTFAVDDLRDRHPGRGLGRDDHHRRLRRCRSQGQHAHRLTLDTWHGKASGQCASIDYGFHMIVSDVNDTTLKEMDALHR